uniref:Secreted protein n=1 Tax=Heterorhabditis bacteriophora TaxID=37862 RepID=A0A1I7X865_HETBA
MPYPLCLLRITRVAAVHRDFGSSTGNSKHLSDANRKISLTFEYLHLMKDLSSYYICINKYTTKSKYVKRMSYMITYYPNGSSGKSVNLSQSVRVFSVTAICCPLSDIWFDLESRFTPNLLT